MMRALAAELACTAFVSSTSPRRRGRERRVHLVAGRRRRGGRRRHRRRLRPRGPSLSLRAPVGYSSAPPSPAPPSTPATSSPPTSPSPTRSATGGAATSIGAKLLHRHTDPLKESVKPKLFVIGTEDDFTSRGATERFARVLRRGRGVCRTRTTSLAATRRCDARVGHPKVHSKISRVRRRQRAGTDKRVRGRSGGGHVWRTCTQTSCRRKRDAG